LTKESIHINFADLSDDNGFDAATYENRVLHGDSGSWKADATPTGGHGDYVNDEKSGVRTCCGNDGTIYTETWDKGMRQP
jgi:hypothetical protein